MSVCIYKTHNRWRKPGVWENVRKQQLLLLHVSGHCADVWAKDLKQATVHMHLCQCCGSARWLWLTSMKRVDCVLRDRNGNKPNSLLITRARGEAVHKKLSSDNSSVACWPETLNLSTVILDRILRCHNSNNKIIVLTHNFFHIYKGVFPCFLAGAFKSTVHSNWMLPSLTLKKVSSDPFSMYSVTIMTGLPIT